MQSLKRVAQLVMALLRELSDENAYARYLKVHGRTHSPEEWRHFCKHRLKAKYANAKCC